jgi:hypothetical protein
LLQCFPISAVDMQTDLIKDESSEIQQKLEYELDYHRTAKKEDLILSYGNLSLIRKIYFAQNGSRGVNRLLAHFLSTVWVNRARGISQL